MDDYKELIEDLRNPDERSPGNFDTPRRGLAFMFGLAQEAADAIERLMAATPPSQEQK